MPDPVSRLNAALEGRYVIAREIGQGGMATVYLARDVRHDRRVALKVLKPELVAVMGAERFLSEIRTTASLQHPHILQLYDSGEADKALYFVMPFVEGETLRDRIDREKQLPVEEAVGIARAVAAALQAAHAQGVIHRDIKPANILLSHGEPLVADFGIALAVQQAGGGRLTETGLSLGTPFYMSPEQATADRDPDARSDIYSLGSVLYEMLCGEPPFSGNSAQAVLGKILTSTPARPTELRRAIPRHVEAVILKSLERLPADRFASAAEFGNALGDPSFRHGIGAEATDPAGAAGAAVAGLQRRVRVLTGATVVLAGALVWTALQGGGASRRADDVVEFYVQEDSTHEILAAFPGSMALSPDGRTLAYIGATAGTGRVYLRSWSERRARPVPGTEGANTVSFSHDGSWLVYGTEDFGVFKVRVAGGTPSRVAQLENDMAGSFWAEDGSIYFGEVGLPGLLRVSEDGGSVEELLPQNDTLQGVMEPWLLPGGRVVLVTGLLPGPQLLAYDLREDTYTTLTPGMTPRYVGGYLVYGTEEGTVLAQPFDPERLELTGDPVRIADEVGGWLSISRDLAISPSGAFAYAEGETGVNELLVADAETGDVHFVATASFLRTPRISPDGTRLLYGSGSASVLDLYVASVSQQTSRLLASVPGGFGASWSPDGASIVYGGGIADPGIWKIDLDGAGEPELLYTPDFLWISTVPSYTWDGKHLVFERGPAPADIVALALDGSEELRTVVGGPGTQSQSAPSPTGPWVAYTSDETGRNEVYVVSLDGGAHLTVSSGGGLSPRWAPTGDTLYYWPLRGGDELQAAALSFEGEMSVVSRSTRPAGGESVLEATTITAQYDVRPPRGSARVLASSGGERIVVRTYFLPTGG